jgi:hypothetical protein
MSLPVRLVLIENVEGTPLNDLGPLGLAGFQSTIASVAYPDRFGGLANDYVITPSVSNDQQGFFQYVLSPL